VSTGAAIKREAATMAKLRGFLKLLLG